MNPRDMKKDNSALGELYDGYAQIEELTKKLDELWTGKKRLLNPETIGFFRYLARDTKRHIEKAIKKLQRSSK